MDGSYRIFEDDGRQLIESFVAAPGPMGFRWFGRVRAAGSQEDVRLVDHTVDREWRLVRLRLMDLEAGVEMVALAGASGIAVTRVGGPSPGDWVVPGAEAVWTSSPSALFVAASRIPIGSGLSLAGARIAPEAAPGPVTIGPLRAEIGDKEAATLELDGERIEVRFRDGWPIWAERRFELLG
jgi:hypothetical protein